MEKRELIIQLIEQDLRHNQLVLGLNKMELDSAGFYELEISRIIGRLMGIPFGRLDDHWGDIYDSFMEQSLHYPVKEAKSRFKTLAEACYNQLVHHLDNNQL